MKGSEHHADPGAEYADPLPPDRIEPKTTSSESTKVENTTRSKLDDWTIKNTFAPNFTNEYFDPATLFGACRYSSLYDDLPEEGKQMVLAYEKEYLKRCTKPGDPPREIPDFPKDSNAIL